MFLISFTFWILGENPIRTVEKYVPSVDAWQPARSLLHERSGLSLIVLPHALSGPFTSG